MKLIKGIIMSIGMFSVIPVTKNSWDEKAMPLIIPSMSIVGCIIGTIWYFLSVFISKTDIPLVLKSAFILLIPFLLSGFLHIDGYMDTADAILSRRDLDEKRRILKDSTVGAFAVIAFVCLFMLQFSAVYSIIAESKKLYGFVFIPIVSRGVAGIGLLTLRSMSKTGFGASFKANTKLIHIFSLIFFIAASLVAAIFLNGVITVVPLICTLTSGICVTFYVYRQMQGMSGDLCGCIITLSELAGIICMAII